MQVGRLREQPFGDQFADLRRHMRCREMCVVRQSSNGDTLPSLPMCGAHQHNELGATKRHGATERLAKELQAAEGQHHEIDHLAELRVGALYQEIRMRHGRGWDENPSLTQRGPPRGLSKLFSFNGASLWRWWSPLCTTRMD